MRVRAMMRSRTRGSERRVRSLLSWASATSVATVCLLASAVGCTGQERACGLDGACPPNTACIDQLCKNVPWWSDVSALADATGGADGCDKTATATPRASAMLPRASPAGGWLSGRLLVHGGDVATAGRCTEMGRSTKQGGSWAPCDGWRAAAPGTPPSRSGAASTVGLGSAWLVGGWQRDATAGPWIVRGDLWRFGGSAGTWSLATSQSIPARHHAAIAMQTEPPSVWVHGGDASGTAGVGVLLPDLRRYRLDLSAWELPPTTGQPPVARAEHALVALGGGEQLLLFGGRSHAGLLGDLWVFNTQTMAWTRLPESGNRPTPRRGAALATTATDVWLFGGRDDSAQGFRNDLWRMPLTSVGKWQRIRAGDLGKGATSGGVVTPLGDPCLAPSGFTALDPLSPPRRSHALFAAGDDALWLFGGRGECGALGDIWRLAPGGTWTLAHKDRRGWSCERRGASCGDLCGP